MNLLLKLSPHDLANHFKMESGKKMRLLEGMSQTRQNIGLYGNVTTAPQ
jgi:hypothetical protein